MTNEKADTMTNPSLDDVMAAVENAVYLHEEQHVSHDYVDDGEQLHPLRECLTFRTAIKAYGESEADRAVAELPCVDEMKVAELPCVDEMTGEEGWLTCGGLNDGKIVVCAPCAARARRSGGSG